MKNQSQKVLGFKINTLKTLTMILKLATGITVVTFLTPVNCIPVNAQTSTVETDYLEDIQAGKDSEWNFSGTTESISIEEDIKNLGEYRIQTSDVSDVQLTQKERRNNNSNSIQDYSVKTEIFDY